MASLKTKFAVGLFVLVGLIIVGTASVWLGLSHYLEGGRLYVAYFDQSVQGLSKDSAVKYRGVSIGRVQSVRVAPDGYLIETVLKIETDLKVEDNMIAQLKAIGITGIMFIELDRISGAVPKETPKIDFKPRYPVIPTQPSVITKFMEAADDLLKKIEALNLNDLVDTAASVIGRIDQMVGETDIRELLSQTGKTLEAVRSAIHEINVAGVSQDFRETLKRIETLADPGEWSRTLTAVRSAADRFNRFSGTAETTVAGAQDAITEFKDILAENRDALRRLTVTLNQTASAADGFFRKGGNLLSNDLAGIGNLKHMLVRTLEQVQTLSENMNQLVESLSEHPSKLLLGPPPPRKEFGDMSTGR